MVLGIDAATTKSGYAILADNKNIISFGVIRTVSKEYISRIRELYLAFRKILESYPKISAIVLEDVPISNHNNLRTGKELSALQGMILTLSFEFNIPIKLYTPSSWRSTIGTYDGTRQGMKRDIQKQKAVDMVNKMYGLNFVYNATETKTRTTDDDKAEAICIALAYIKNAKKED